MARMAREPRESGGTARHERRNEADRARSRRREVSAEDRLKTRLPVWRTFTSLRASSKMGSRGLVPNRTSADSPSSVEPSAIRIDRDPASPDGHVVRMTTRSRADAERREAARPRVEVLDQADDAFAYYLTLVTRAGV
jgi:hypothetical protein